jgi:hypothetical protein
MFWALPRFHCHVDMSYALFIGILCIQKKGEFVIDRVEFIIYCLPSLQCFNINNALIYQGILMWTSQSTKGYATFHPQNYIWLEHLLILYGYRRRLTK